MLLTEIVALGLYLAAYSRIGWIIAFGLYPLMVTVSYVLRAQILIPLEHRPADEELFNRLAMIAERTGMPLHKVFIDDSEEGEYSPSAAVDLKGSIILSKKLLEEFTPEEIEFGVVLEIERVKSWYSTKSVALVCIGVMLPAIIAITAFLKFGFDRWYVTFAACSLITYLLFIVTTRLSYNQTKATDYRALKASRDLKSAESAIRKLSEYPSARSGFSFGALLVDRRLRMLRESAVSLEL